MLSIVLPVRITRDNAYLLDRLRANLELFGRYEGIECVVVDSDSDRRYQPSIRGACDRSGRVLVSDPAPKRPFAPGLTRNAGVRAASGDTILFYDVDLACDASLVPRVLEWAAAAREPTDFLMIPCLYLTREATGRLDFRGEPVDLEPLLRSALAGDNRLVTHVAVSTSTVAVSREHFLAIGGNRPEYHGHGCEDFDLLHRLASHHPIGRRPDDYYVLDKSRFPGSYRGLRAYLARYAIPLLFEGLYTAHLWHPRPLQRAYFRRRRRNEELLQELMRRHDARGSTGDLPAPWAGADRPLPPLVEEITALQRRHGLDPSEHPGLFRWRDGVSEPRGTVRTRLRKLALRPGAFFADSRVPPLRVLRHLFPR